MKKVEVFHTIYDDTYYLADPDHSTNIQDMLEKWLKTDDGKFCVKESKTKLEIVEDFTDLYYHKRIRIFAEFDEKIETFWRLKFK